MTAEAGIASLVGAVTGNRSRAIGVAAGIAVASYVFYPLANRKGVLKPISSAMLFNGLR